MDTPIIDYGLRYAHPFHDTYTILQALWNKIIYTVSRETVHNYQFKSSIFLIPTFYFSSMLEKTQMSKMAMGRISLGNKLFASNNRYTWAHGERK